jgi:hypothetical protein
MRVDGSPVAWCTLLVVATACASPMASPDAGRDAGLDAGRARDAGRDASLDAASDADATSTSDAGPPQPWPVRFTDVTAEAGLATPHLRPERCILERVRDCEIDHMTGGAAVGDVDADGWPDLYVTMLQGPDHLYRNRGDGTFEDITEQAGLLVALHSNGAAFADIDEDGDLDLYVTTLGLAGDPINGRFHLFVNDGSGHFNEEAIPRGVALDDGRLHSGTSVAVGDYDRDGFADLHVSEWLQRPEVRPHTRLFRNRGFEAPGRFQDVTATSGAMTFSRECWNMETPCTAYAWANAFSDLDGDGWQDLVVVSDFGRTRLFWNRGDGTFTLGFLTVDIGGDENGMGSTIADLDGDGRFEWFVTSIWDPAYTCALTPCTWGASGNRLYRFRGRTILDGTDEAGVRESGWGWGTAAFDHDNDGDLDLVAANGIEFPGSMYDDAFNREPMRFWDNDGTGRMTDRSEQVGLTDRRDGKGLLVFDYDQDGDLDVFIVNNGELPALYRNDGGSTASWLRVRAIGTVSTSESLGAIVRLRVRADSPLQVREIGSVSHFQGQSEREAHFGLGRGVERVAQLDVRWPSGRTVRLTDVPARQTLVLVEPE